jgi:predicted kinase
VWQMPKLYIMVALPRSGKSTYVNKHFPHIVKVSADQLRLLIYGKRFWYKGEPEVWATRDIMLRALLEQGVDIVIDETNINKKSRSPILELAQEFNYHTVAIVIKTDKETCKERAIKTGQPDLISVIERMANIFEDVTEDEGFNEIIVISGHQMEMKYEQEMEQGSDPYSLN